MTGERCPRAMVLLAIQPLVWLVPGLRHACESRMVLHMFVQFPSLLAGGWALGSLALQCWPDLPERFDPRGFVGAVALACLSAFWMIPAALDLALLVPEAELAKVASWLAAGALCALGWSRLADVPRLFLVGNLVWMFGTAGLLYQGAEQRLCVNYLVGEQLWAGRLMVGLALLLPVASVLALWRRASGIEARRADASLNAGVARRACNSDDVGARSLS